MSWQNAEQAQAHRNTYMHVWHILYVCVCRTYYSRQLSEWRIGKRRHYNRLISLFVRSLSHFISIRHAYQCDIYASRMCRSRIYRSYCVAFLFLMHGIDMDSLPHHLDVISSTGDSCAFLGRERNFPFSQACVRKSPIFSRLIVICNFLILEHAARWHCPLQ